MFYVTEYEGIDVAVGFTNVEGITNYLGVQDLNYDIILIDIDSSESFSSFNMNSADKNYFITAFDSYSLKKGLDIIKGLSEKITMKKILFSRDMTKEEDEYLNFLSYYFPVIWDKDKIFFPHDHGDSTVILENQRASRMRYKTFSQNFRDSLVTVAREIDPTIKNGDIKRLFKII